MHSEQDEMLFEKRRELLALERAEGCRYCAAGCDATGRRYCRYGDQCRYRAEDDSDYSSDYPVGTGNGEDTCSCETRVPWHPPMWPPLGALPQGT